ncbi:unnamed protein product [Rodentolepis nana]|uniref:Uncharacterized protein n=1 Tax=Rodentolepis nana TaxID=102285 RepID=A0A3P7UV19_RODNA|nr:unnamed protein product [Rodentolepis nana]
MIEGLPDIRRDNFSGKSDSINTGEVTPSYRQRR